MADTLPHVPPLPTPNGSVESAAAYIDALVAHGALHLSERGRAILEARRAIEQSGEPLLSREEREREKIERRGGVESR